MHEKGIVQKVAPWAALLALTAGFLSFALWRCGIFPFGDSSILLVDLGEQYSDFLVFFRTSSLAEKVYSFSKGFGGETLGLTAYYLLSPFNLLTYLFSPAQIESAVVLILYAKFGAIACCAYFYFSRRGEPGAPAFALAYALCPFFVMYFFNILWLDGFALLPLLAWGCEQVLEKGKTRFFTAVYCCALLTNYYIAYMASLFILLYFFFYGGAKLALPAKALLRRAGAMARAVGIAACLTAPILLPALRQLQNGKLANAASATWQGGRMFNPLLALAGVFSGTFLYETVPFLFFTMGTLLLLLAFFASRAYPLRLKLGAAALWGFLCLSLYWRPLYLLWHGMQMPEGFPYRFYFVYYFFLLWLCQKGLAGLTALHQKGFALAAAAALAACAGLYFATRASLPWGAHTALRTALVTAACLAGIAAASRGKTGAGNTPRRAAKPPAETSRESADIKSGSFGANAAVRALACILAAAVLCDSVTLFQSYYAGSTSAGAVRDYAQNYTTKQALLAQTDAPNGFCRTEDISQRPGNQPMALGYCGTTHYSSTFDNIQAEIYAHFLGKESFLGTYYNDSRLAVDSFFGIRWLMAGENVEVDAAYRRTAEENGSILYENPDALPVLFAMQKVDLPWAEDSAEHLNTLYAALNGGKTVCAADGTVDEAALAEAAAAAQAGAAQITQKNGGSLTATVTAGENEMLAMTIPYDTAWQITVDGERVSPQTFMGYFMCIPLESGAHTVRMRYIPAGLPAGLALCGGCGVILLAGFAWRRKKRGAACAGKSA